MDFYLFGGVVYIVDMCRVVEYDCVGKEDGIEFSNELVFIIMENVVSVEELSCWGLFEVNMVLMIKGWM